jgi:hypothetical protein
MEHNKAPSPDGFPAEFYQHFWSVIKCDLMAMFRQFHAGELPLYKVIFGVITLLPKKENAIQIQQYRPISFLNVSLKIFTKVGTIRISEIARKVIRPTQTTFMPGRFFSRVTGGEIPTACCIPLERPGQGMILQTYK